MEKEAVFAEMGGVRPRVSKGRCSWRDSSRVAGLGGGCNGVTPPSAQPTHSRVFYLGGSLIFAFGTQGKYLELRLMVQLFPDTGEACLSLAAPTAPEGHV